MKVFNITGSTGRKVPNQFIIRDSEAGASYFQSCNSIIVKQWYNPATCQVETILDCNTWDYSYTTGKYRNLFLGETKKETEAKIKNGEYTLANLN